MLSHGSQYPASFVPPLPFFHAGASRKTIPLELLAVKIPTKVWSTVVPVKVEEPGLRYYVDPTAFWFRNSKDRDSFVVHWTQELKND